MSNTGFAGRMTSPLGRLFDFRGRSGRAEHWPFMGLLIAVYAAGTLLALQAQPLRSAFLVIQLLLVVLALLASASVVRRLHDAGWSGWWMGAFLALLAANSAFFLYWRYGVVHPVEPDRIGMIWPWAMAAGWAMWGIGLLIFVVTVFDGTGGPNRYGPAPSRPAAAT
jgi:uncharacterized membrane protein YhaH (DUF805 family)